MKNLSSLGLLLLILFSSCHKIKEENLNQNEELIKQLYTHFNNHAWDKMAALYKDTAEFKDPSFGKEIIKQTRQEIEIKYKELHQLFPDIHDEVINIYPSGDKNVIVEFVSTGTAPDSSKFELPICTIFTIENGLITKDFTYYDNFEEPQE